MRVCGVIAEYDPFHKGHAYHLQAAREKTEADFIVCIMSGSFTQRGMPALLPAHSRAEMALRCGADIVLQLPYAFSVREGDGFALGGVEILHRLSCITHLSFGAENDDLSLIKKAALLLEQPDSAFQSALQAALDKGHSHAEATGRALTAALGHDAATLKAPNNALALCYLRALLRLGSTIMPVPVLRASSYHHTELDTLPSATAVRGTILRGDWGGIENAIPKAALPALQRAIQSGLCRPEGMDALLRARLLLSTEETLAALPGIGEGLEKRILMAAKSCISYEEILSYVKTRRYTQGRISRALCHCLMQVTADDLPAHPTHARILGFRQKAQPLLKEMQKSDFPLITRPAGNALCALDLRADEMRQIIAGLPRGETYRISPCIVE